MAKPSPRSLAIRGRHAAPALVFATAAVAVALSYLSARSLAQVQATRRFERLATGNVEAIERRVDAYVGMLRAGAGLVAALGREPTAAEFHAHAAALDPGGRFPGLLGLGWVRLLRPSQLAAHERAMRAAGLPGYRVWPEGRRDVYTATVHVEPHPPGGERNLGFDMFTEPIHREAMARARDEGLPAASGRVDLERDGGSGTAGLFVYLPVYAGRDPPAGIAARREALLGWVYAQFAADELVESSLGRLVVGAELTVFDGSEQDPGAVLASAGDAGGAPWLVRVDHVSVAGRPWTLRLVSRGAFLRPDERRLPLVVGGVGAAIALLLSWITLREAQARAHAERVAARKAFLADAGHLLSASFDYSRTLDDVVRLAAGPVADGAVLYLDEAGEPTWYAGHETPGVAARLAEALRGWRPHSDDAVGLAAALRAGRPLHVKRLRLDRPPVSRLPELAATLRAAGVRAALTVPLVARGEPLGGIVLLSSRRFRAFRPETIALAEDLARLAVSAVESARLFRRAQDAVRSRDEFLSIASHELKTPITSLVLQADSLRSSAQRGDAEAFLRKIEVIRRSVRRLSGLVSSMLDLSRIQAGRLELEPEDVDLVEIAREVVGRFEDEARRAHSPLRLSAIGPATGRWDRLRLDQVVTNLVSNALKYGRGKPVDVTVEIRGEAALLSVRDGGIGIEPADQPRIFERFERAVSDRHYGGFGLGLWIVREVVTAMGGHIRLDSAPGMGSTFTVELPRPAVPLRAEPGQAGPASEPGRAGPGRG